ncbi:MAG: hypothetical protein H0X51_08655 [Parachlamydiaceae bacterium]|nr:hypothetical protein [Parachlamydiaceae bacterium]
MILNQLQGEFLKKYIFSETLQIKEEERAYYFEDVMEDLKEIDESRLAGLGVTPDQLNLWKSVQS